MLKAPIRKIGGYGTFFRYVDRTASEAWQSYGLNNGVDSETELVNKISRFAEKRSKNFLASADPTIGCIELSDVITFDDAQFITPEQCGHSFPNQVVKLKYFNEVDRIATHFSFDTDNVESFVMVTGDATHKLSQRKDRKGQSMFRKTILQNYEYQCCISGDSVAELLEAAHIQPYIDDRSNHPQNGLCLRVDLHRLFDAGLITINEELTVQVSQLLVSTSYYKFTGTKMRLPSDQCAYPSAAAIKYRNAEEFRG